MISEVNATGYQTNWQPLFHDCARLQQCVSSRIKPGAAKRVARVLKPGGWLFFHDGFARARYRDRFSEMLEDYALCEELSVTGTTQTLAVFRRHSGAGGMTKA